MNNKRITCFWFGWDENLAVDWVWSIIMDMIIYCSFYKDFFYCDKICITEKLPSWSFLSCSSVALSPFPLSCDGHCSLSPDPALCPLARNCRVGPHYQPPLTTVLLSVSVSLATQVLHVFAFFPSRFVSEKYRFLTFQALDRGFDYN